MSELRVLKIPIERISVTVQIKNPMKIPMDAVRVATREKLESASLKRLFALTRYFPTDRNYVVGGEIRLDIIRDLYVGKTSQCWNEPDTKNISFEYMVEQKKERISEEQAKRTVSELLHPYQSRLSAKSNLDRDTALHGTEIQTFAPGADIEYIKVVIRQVSGVWIPNDNNASFDSKTMREIIKSIPSLQPKPPAPEPEQKEWHFAPEVDALMKLETAKNGERIKVARRIVESIQQDFDKLNLPRLDSVSSLVGFRSDMWNAAQAVINSSDKHTFILSSFTNPKYIENAAKRIADSSGKAGSRTVIAFGEPDRERDPDDIKNTERYMEDIQGMSPNIKCGISPQPNHAKVIVSDTGMVLLCSCNLFSGDMESVVLESGLLIKDVKCAIKIMATATRLGWISKELKNETEQLLESLQKRPEQSHKLRIKEKLSTIRNALNNKKFSAVDDLEKLLRLIAERPAWSLLTDLDHRQFMRDCAGRFNNYLALASDGLRSTGLDKATMEIIAERAKETKANVMIWWGRHAPNSRPFDEDDKRIRQDAAGILKEMQARAREDKWQFAPRKSDQPMETHAKLFVVDALRLMISSDNTLAFSDAEWSEGDAGEMGIVIDHPRLALQTRGIMELWLPSAQKFGDWNRWWAVLAEEISCVVNQPDEKISLELVLDAMMDRIQSDADLLRDWEDNFEKNLNQDEILNKLMLGDKYGMFSVSKVPKTGISQTMISLSQNSVWQKIPANNQQ